MMQTTASNQSKQAWHVEQWGLWGWLETIFKLIAAAAGIAAFIGTASASTFIISGSPHLAAVILLGLLTLVSLGVIFVRFGQREVVSMIFALLNFLGHAGLLIALLRAPQQPALAIVFGAFWLIGQLVKLQFLRASGYTEGGQTTPKMLQVTAILAVIYAVFTVLVLV